MSTTIPSEGLKLRVILVGIGGATSSGKTTLAKHLRQILPGSFIVHQDDFAPPQKLIPIHPLYGVQDWDAAEGAIDWPRLVQALREVKETGRLPPEHTSHDHMNEQKNVPVESETIGRWSEAFKRIEDERAKQGERLVWVMVDGFLLYWNSDIVQSLDVRIFLRVPHDVLKQRRHERHGYHTAVQSDPEGAFWRDPPQYWEQIVWPAYVDAHKAMLEGGDVEKGQSNGKVEDLQIIEGLEVSIDQMLDRVCASLQKVVEDKQ